MTTIIAILDDSGTWIGSDLMCSVGNFKYQIKKKWLVDKETGWALALAGNAVVMNLIERYFVEIKATLPEPYLFVDRVKKLFADNDFNMKHESNSFAPSSNQYFMIAGPNCIYTIGSDFTFIDRTEEGLWAEGSGMDWALGALEATRGLSISVEDRISQAIDIACKFNTTSGMGKDIQQIYVNPRQISDSVVENKVPTDAEIMEQCETNLQRAGIIKSS